MADLLKRFQQQRCDRVFTKLIGPDLKSYWPNRNRDIINMTSSLYSSDIPLKEPTQIGAAFRKLLRLLPMSVNEVARENMIEWRKRRGGGRKTLTQGRQ